MLTMKPRQWTQLGHASRQQFHRRLLAHARSCFEGWEPDDQAALGAIRQVHDQADTLGLTDELSVCRYLNLTILLGGTYRGRFPWIDGVLRDTDKPAAHRLDLIDRRVEAELKPPHRRAAAAS